MIQGDPYTYTTVASGTGDAQGIAATPGLRLMAWSVKESAGSPDVATLNLRHGTAASDPIMAAINLAASGSDGKWYGPQGLQADSGVFVDRLTGESTVYLTTCVM